MPQLDILSFSSELIWFLLLFVVSFFIFLFFLLPNVYAVLRTREKRRYSLNMLVKSSELNSKFLDSYTGKSPLSLSFASSSEPVSISPKKSFDLGYNLFNSALSKLLSQNHALNSAIIVDYYIFLSFQSAELDNFNSFLGSYQEV
jgi:hypothetical protein